MQGKELLSKMFRNYFVLVTLINIVIFVSGSIARPDARFGYSVFIMPLIYAFAGILPQAVMYSKRELSIKEVLIRKLIQLLLIELLVNGIILGEDVLRPENTDVLKTISVCVVLVYVFANIISWVLDSASARTLTRELAEFQEKYDI
ncbi:MAG: hypothetical protein PUK75_10525 [bacterium]|nr:hypothetical protein [bacterium]MDY4100254.1 hypothetical protein [Lachnospiraceae bacterium]